MVARRAHNPKVVGSKSAPTMGFYVFYNVKQLIRLNLYKQQARITFKSSFGQFLDDKKQLLAATIGRRMEQYGSSSGS